MVTVGKLLVAVVWIFSARAFLLPEGDPFAATGRTIFFAMLAVHGIECLAFLPRLRAAGGSFAGHVAQTLLFGFLHLGPLRKTTAELER